MAATFTVRPATPADVDAIARVHVLTWQEAYQGQIPDEFLRSLSIEGRADAWRRWWAEGRVGDQELFVAEIDGAIVGFVNVGPCRDEDADGETGEVRAIYVLPDHWDLGAGRALMEAGLDSLRARYGKAVLWTLDSNDRARRFYEKAGWSCDGATKEDEARGVVLRQVRFRVDLQPTAQPVP